MSVDQVSTDAILKERGKTHGEITDNAQTTIELWQVMEKGKNWSRLSATQKHSLYMTQHKIARILAGDPDFIDHWEDPAGYLTAVAQSNELQQRLSNLALITKDPVIFVNSFQMIDTGDNLRVAFTEAVVPELPPLLRSSLVMPHTSGRNLARVLTEFYAKLDAAAEKQGGRE